LPLDDGQVAIWWVGQSGFAVRAGSHSFLIDPYMIPHHFGMFDFNTIDPLDLRAKIEKIPDPVRVILPEINMAYCFSN
jgi:L-ascorbate metabolism protein UlaG (beta-lactamase superfamily)